MQRRAFLILVVFSILASPAVAGSSADGAKQEVDWRKPLVYSGSMMFVGFFTLETSGVFDENISVHNFRRAFHTGPVEDDDSNLFNLVLHPLWGSETYLRAREGNMGVWGSIGFSFLMSVTWEYFFESWVEHPSRQDLIYTSGIGWMIGEWRYRMKNRLGPKHDWWLDPLDTTLRHIRIAYQKDRSGKSVPIVMFSCQF